MCLQWPFQVSIAAKLPNYLNILRKKLYALILSIEDTKNLPTYTFIFTDSLNRIYLLLNHIRHPSSQHNHLDELLIIHIRHAIKILTHKITIMTVCAHTYIKGNNKADKLAKQGALQPHIAVIPFHHIGHTTPFRPAIPPTSTQHDDSVHDQKLYVISYKSN